MSRVHQNLKSLATAPTIFLVRVEKLFSDWTGETVRWCRPSAEHFRKSDVERGPITSTNRMCRVELSHFPPVERYPLNSLKQHSSSIATKWSSSINTHIPIIFHYTSFLGNSLHETPTQLRFLAKCHHLNIPNSSICFPRHPWQNVTYAFWLRYPNPFASHVIGADVLERSVDPVTGVLRTTRLLLKSGVLPKWAPKGIVKSPETFVIEESEVDPKTHTMITRTKNLSHARVMQVEETQIVKLSPENPEWTTVRTEARVISRFGWGLTQRIERFGAKRFADNTARVRICDCSFLMFSAWPNLRYFPFGHPGTPRHVVRP
ncbi:LOW QUALITY PROTEIN: PRELI-like family-domain-containing protein [Jimgerdemannia flammicorona]|uniref:PRELI-like family-domain-containing protein n=1 Tax=Jimgerdemannia flammicorona TaxID=994334 RepID=A0A433QWZ6_9FUNG|nr:LOW QUALITY PROTEIN: PRELI-like family-domain-containing protein [Jimgerdemannia flammicorona]